MTEEEQRLDEIRKLRLRGSLTLDDRDFLIEIIDRERGEKQRLWDVGMPTSIDGAIDWISRLVRKCEESSRLQAALEAIANNTYGSDCDYPQDVAQRALEKGEV